MAELPRGKFIVLEGIDGSGKTTQLEALAAVQARPVMRPY
jgi:thymidylate kinase